MSPRRRAFFFLVLASPGFLPLIFPYLPFQDWPGHIGAAGALHWAGRGELPAEYTVRTWLGPNRLFYVLAAFLSPMTGVLLGSNLVLAVFLGAFGPSVALLIRLSGGDERWALAVLPLALGRVLACGFGCNAMALTPLCLGLASMLWIPRDPLRGSLAFVLAAAVALGLHAFVFYVMWGFSLLTTAYLLSRPSTRKAGYASLGAWAVLSVGARFFGHYGDPNHGQLLSAIVSSLELRSPAKLASSFWEWLFAYHRTAVFDDVAQAIWLGALGLGIYRRFPNVRNSPDLVLLWSWVCAGLLAFVALPESIGPPVNWWGGNLRVPVVVGILLVVLAAKPLDARAAQALKVATLAGAAFLVLTSSRIADFSIREMGGFGSLVDRIPARQRVCAIHFSGAALHEFPGEPHWYVANYYLANTPGLVSANLFGNGGEVVEQAGQIPQPGWGQAEGFDWNTHFSWCDYLLVRSPLSRDYVPPTRADIEVIGRSEHWTLIAKRR